MRLSEWAKLKGRGELSRLSHATGLAYTTVLAGVEGKLKRYDVAKKISDATGGEVTVAELCEPASVERESAPESSEPAA